MSSFSPARRGVGYCCASYWCCFCASSCGACGFPRRVLPQVTLRGLATFLAPVACPTPEVELCLLGLRCLVRHLASYLVPCSSSEACGLRCLPCRRLPLGVSAFSDTVCLTYCCAGGVGWAATLPFCYQCFSCTGWLAGVRWVLHPVSGSSHRGCDCPLVDNIVVLFFTLLASRALFVVLSSPPAVLDFCWGLCGSLLAFPCLRVGALLACGVYGASSLRSLQFRLPFVVSPPFPVSVCPSPALAVGWFGHRSVAPPAAPVCWALVGSLLRRFVALAYSRTLSFSCFSPGFLPLAFVRTSVGRLRSCRGSCLLLGGVNSPSLVLVVFAWRFLQFGCPGSLSFL